MNSKNGRVALACFLIISSVISLSIPYGVIIPILFVTCGLLVTIPMEKIINTIWMGIILSSFCGSYLGIPGNQSIFLFRILLILHFILFIFYRKKEWFDLSELSKFKALLILLGVWFIGNFISLFWSSIRGESFRYIYYVFEACYLMVLVIYYTPYSRSSRFFINVITVFYLIAIFVGLIEVLTGWHMPLSGSLFYETTTSKFQPTAFLFNTNDYAMFLTIYFPLVFNRLWDLKNHLWKVCISNLVLILSLYLVITTYSRLGIVAIVVEVIIIFLYFMKKSLVFLTFGISVYLLVDSFIQQGSLFKIEQIVVSAFTKKGASTDERMYIYMTSWDIVRDSNFLGVGAGNLPIQIMNYWMGHESTALVYKAPHNFWLESMGGIGIFALSITIFILVVLALSIRIFFINIRGINTFQYLLPALIVLVFIFSSIGLSTIIEKRYIWLALGLAIRMTDINFYEKKDDY